MPISSNVYGTFASNAVTYSIAAVAAGGSVTALKYAELVSRISDERVRRGKSSFALSLTNPIGYTEFNSMLTNLNVKGQAATQAYENSYGGTGEDQNLASGGGTPLTYATFPQAAEPSGIPANVTTGTAITASTINSLITAIKNAGAVCTCNCNYCTCNCNYCTCNCNYSCTCNCNYSDERLKANITLVESVDGVNLYSYTYIWNKDKTYIGVLAQEILKSKYASAVMTDSNGFYYVDYSQLPVNMIEA